MNKLVKTIFYAAAMALLLAVSMTGCKQQSTGQSFQATDITGVDFGKDFQLTDHNGKLRTLSDFRGKLVVMFFGYTHCPDVCPTTMSDLAQALNLMGNNADKVQVLFVTIDPERDTQALLSQYVPAFNPGFLGLMGDEAATAKVAKDFRIFYQKVKSKDGKSYEVDHTSGTYVFDQTGKLRLFMKYGQGAQSIAHDLNELLDH
jgi:protein SCO1/2